MAVVHYLSNHSNGMKIKRSHTILFVEDLAESKAFYQSVLDQSPHLDVPGMVEFLLTEKHVLGLMPNDGIARIICPALPHPSEGQGIPRCEMYMIFEKLDPIIQRLERL